MPRPGGHGRDCTRSKAVIRRITAMIVRVDGMSDWDSCAWEAIEGKAADWHAVESRGIEEVDDPDMHALMMKVRNRDDHAQATHTGRTAAVSW
jgi:hypothetical protein